MNQKFCVFCIAESGIGQILGIDNDIIFVVAFCIQFKYQTSVNKKPPSKRKKIAKIVDNALHHYLIIIIRNFKS
ncbi:hypothetical protein BpHYR1_017093 [Brachionus plicatilis]|uniref:Uncharacterized protein n=1 Tax=Brachionus plicatilis TaxID=10195 RepID=A0A3M7RG32_BRAPC|nr:hypothetical protein BpHYR1_017093 [Brachionus plicatilis]